MNPNIHYSVEAVAFIIVMAFTQFKTSSINSRLEEHIKKSETDVAELSAGLNNLYGQMDLIRNEMRTSIAPPPLQQQYALPPQARAPAPGPPQGHQGPNPYQQHAPQRAPPRSQSPPPRGSREDLGMGHPGMGAGGHPGMGAGGHPGMGAGHPGMGGGRPGGMDMMSPGVQQAVRNVSQGVSRPPPQHPQQQRQMPGMPENPQSPQEQTYDNDDEGGPGNYATFDDEPMPMAAKGGGLRQLASQMEQMRSAQIPTKEQ